MALTLRGRAVEAGPGARGLGEGRWGRGRGEQAEWQHITNKTAGQENSHYPRSTTSHLAYLL